jgi:branched-chain amino acid transport system substrate-binding protein
MVLRRYGAPLVSLVAVAALIAACSSSGNSSAGGTQSGAATSAKCPIKVAAVGALTGVSAAYAAASKAGIELSADAINKSKQKVLGCPVQVTFIDDGSNTANIPGLLEKAISGGYSYTFLFAVGQDVGLQFMNTQHQLEIGSYGDAGYNDPSKYPYWFDMASSDDAPMVDLAKRLAAAGYRRIALVQSSVANLGGTDQADVQTGLKGTNAQLVVTQSVPLDITDATAVALKVKAAHPDAIIADLYGPPLGVVLQALHTAGLNQPDFGTIWAAAGDIAAETTPADLANYTLDTKANSVQDALPGVDAIGTQALALVPGHKLGAPLSGVLEPYDDLQVWAAAVNGAKSFKSSALKAWLEANGNSVIPGILSLKS